MAHLLNLGWQSVQNLHMSKLVGDGKGRAEAIVLDDCAAVLAAHSPELCEAESITILLCLGR